MPTENHRAHLFGDSAGFGDQHVLSHVQQPQPNNWIQNPLPDGSSGNDHRK
eukprot:SAG31_NODE_8307_length_1477_cov_1.320755_1_plen_50_part_10